MGPATGAIETGLSTGVAASSAAAAEAAGTAAVNALVDSAPAIAESGAQEAAVGLGNTVQGVVNATEGAVGQATGGMAEAADNIAMAGGAEQALATSPDAAINSIASAPVEPTVNLSDEVDGEGSAKAPPSSVTESAPSAIDVISSVEPAVAPSQPAEPSPAVSPSVTESPVAQSPSAEAEQANPTADVSKIPGRVANDPEFKQRWGDIYAQAKQQGGEIDVEKIDKQALDEYYANFASTQLEQGIPDEIKNDELFQQKLGEAVLYAQKTGETFDQNTISKDALAKYKREKDLQEEQTAAKSSEQSQLAPEQQRIQQLEKQIAQLNESLLTLKSSVEELTKMMIEKETDPKKKEGLLKLLARIAAIVVVSAVIEGGQEVNPIKVQR